jgi:hypothetical protein
MRVMTAAVRVRTSLAPSPTSVGAARRFVRDVLLTRRVDPAVVDTVELLTSEIVTSALLHARASEELLVILGRDRVRIEMTDSDPEAASCAPVDPETDGPGRAIVEALAAGWGVEPGPAGANRVWFEVVA